MVFNNILQISAYNLCSIRSNKRLFEDVNFTIQNGSIMEIYGSNGTGKTTLLKIISGMILPSKGDITINNGQIPFYNYKESIAFLDSSPTFKEDLTVMDYLIYWALMYNNIKHLSYRYVDNVLSQVGIDSLKNLEISKLSLGQKKRLLISKILLINRQVWLLDEPYIGLDSFWTLKLNNIIHEHKNNGGIVILSTHIKINSDNTCNITLDGIFE